MHNNHKLIEQFLGASVRGWQTTFDAITDLVALIDLNGRFLRCNKAMADFLELSFDEILGRDYYKLVYGSDSPPEQCPFRRMKETNQRETLIWQRNDRILHISVDPLFDEEGNLKGGVHIITDITQRKQVEKALQKSEEKYRSLFEDSPIPLWEEDLSQVKKCIEDFGKKGIKDFRKFFKSHPQLISELARMVKIEDVNKAAIEMYNAGTKEEIQKKLGQFFLRDSRDLFIEELVAIAEGKRSLEREGIAKTFSGEKKHIVLNWAVASGFEATLEKVLVSVLDITERKKAEKQLKKAYSDLKKARLGLIQSEKLAALGNLASSIAHEIKNPLGIVLGGIEFVDRKLKKILPEPDKDLDIAIKKIKESIFRTDDFIHGLLRFSRPSDLKKERIEISSLIEETLFLLKYRVPLKNINVRREQKKEKIFVYIDKNQMQQVLFNVLTNAVEAMPNGGKLKIKTYKASKIDFLSGKPALVIEIQDTGVGISKEDLSKVLKPYFTTKKDEGGTGLGLFTAKMIMNSHNGELMLDSELGEGTCAEIILPLVNERQKD